VLAAIVDAGPIRLSDLAEMLGRTVSNTSKIVQGLVVDGYVRRSIPDADRRVTLLEATTPGRDVIDRIKAFDLALIAHHLSTFTDDEVRTFVGLMSAFTNRIVSWSETDFSIAGGTTTTNER